MLSVARLSLQAVSHSRCFSITSIRLHKLPLLPIPVYDGRSKAWRQVLTVDEGIIAVRLPDRLPAPEDETFYEVNLREEEAFTRNPEGYETFTLCDFDIVQSYRNLNFNFVDLTEYDPLYRSTKYLDEALPQEFSPEQDLERGRKLGLQEYEYATWNSLAVEGAPDAALKLLHHPSSLVCHPPQGPPGPAVLRTLANRLHGWLEAFYSEGGVYKHPANDTYDETLVGIGRLVDIIERYDLKDPYLVLQALVMTVKFPVDGWESRVQQLARRVEGCRAVWAPVASEVGLAPAKAEKMLGLLDEVERDIIADFSCRTAFDPFFKSVSTEVHRSRLLAYVDHLLDCRFDSARSTFELSPHFVLPAVLHHAVDPICRILLDKVYKEAERLPEVKAQLQPLPSALNLVKEAETDADQSTVPLARSREIRQRARTLLAQEQRYFLANKIEHWERIFPGIVAQAESAAARPILFSRWRDCLEFSSPAKAVQCLDDPQQCGLEHLALSPEDRRHFLSSLSAEDLLSPSLARPSISSVVDDLLHHALTRHAEEPNVLLEVQELLLRALGSTNDPRLGAANVALQQHVSNLHSTWDKRFSTPGAFDETTADDLVVRLDRLRRQLDSSSLRSWDVFGSQMSVDMQRLRLRKFGRALDREQASHRPSAADIIAFVQPALLRPRDQYVLLAALRLLDYTSVHGLHAKPSAEALKDALDQPTDAWTRLLADMPSLRTSVNFDYDEWYLARKNRGAHDLALLIQWMAPYFNELDRLFAYMLMPATDEDGLAFDADLMAEDWQDWRDDCADLWWLTFTDHFLLPVCQSRIEPEPTD